MNNNNNHNSNEDCTDGTSYDRWRTSCVDKLKDKLKLNIEKRRKNFEDVVTNAANRIQQDNALEMCSNPPTFRVSSTITTEAVDRMCATIESWPGVHLSQCKNLPPVFKKYWRIADNWWNRQKGKWFGDLFFWSILHWNLHQYTKKILIHKNDQIQFDYAFYIFLCDILHSKVSFKKARPNPLIFDLALEKSPKLQQWFTTQGQQHGVMWEITTRNTQSIKDYAQSWVKAVKHRKYNQFMHFKSNHDPLNIFPPNIKRNSYSDKSDSLSNNSTDNEQDDNEHEDTPHGHPSIDSHHDYRQRSLHEYNALKAELYQHQQQHQIMQQVLNNMQMDLMYKDRYIQQMAYMQQINTPQTIHPMQQDMIKQEPIIYNSNNNNYNINQPQFLPQPPRYPTNVTPEPLSSSNVHPLPPPLKTNAGKERRQSYHDVLNMKEWIKRQQQNDVKPESIHSLHTNHSTLTTASHTTVVSNMPTTSATSGSENKLFYNTHHHPHNQYHYNNNNNPVAALPALHIYGNNYNQGQQQYNYPTNVMPISPIPKQSNNLLPPPPIHPNYNYDDVFDNNMNIEVPFEQEMMDLSMNNLFKIPGMDQLSVPNLSSNSNNYCFSNSNPNNMDNMDMSISNCFVNTI